MDDSLFSSTKKSVKLSLFGNIIQQFKKEHLQDCVLQTDVAAAQFAISPWCSRPIKFQLNSYPVTNLSFVAAASSWRGPRSVKEIVIIIYTSGIN